MQQQNDKEALTALNIAYEEQPNDKLALQLAYLYAKEKNYPAASEYFLLATTSTDANIRHAAQRGYFYSKQEIMPILLTPSATASPESFTFG